MASCGDISLSQKYGINFLVGSQTSHQILSDGETGDIFIQGRGLVKGYWNNPEASKAFEYELEGREGKWYMTGDLGYIKEGKLYLTGRSKDVIIVNGKNIYATDIEQRLELELL